MFDITLIHEDAQRVEKGLAAKNFTPDLNKVSTLDQSRRQLVGELDSLRSEKNAINDEISALIKSKEDPAERIAAMKGISAQIGQLEPKVKAIHDELQGLLIGFPNLPHPSVPVGGEDQNKIVRAWGEVKAPEFKPKDHTALAESLDIIDFKRAAKISGSNFLLFKGAGARLSRALINFMLDTHTSDHNYLEVSPPFVVNKDSMTGTGQLPKMADDMYAIEEENLFLIPTAEVPVTNIHRDEVLKEEDLPLKYVAYTPCFRREAGSYGKGTRGAVRVHQFDKVELVKFVKPETSYQELDALLSEAEKILQLLKLPYRVVELASGDLSFAAAKCFDLEVYVHGLDQWLEVSSCSNFENFQARRSAIRYKGPETKKPRLVHTLNGSGLALARVIVAILENYQTSDGHVEIPEVLIPYMGGKKTIS